MRWQLYHNYEEENAIQYIAGYVYHKLYQTISSGLYKKELLAALNRILMNSDDDYYDDVSIDWCRSIDGGALLYVNDSAYLTLVSLNNK